MQSEAKVPERILFIEPFSGISGDMIIGALLDLGLELDRLEQKLKLLGIDGYRLSASKCVRAGIQAVKFDVHCDTQEDGRNVGRHAGGHHHDDHPPDDHPHESQHHHGHPHRSFRDIRAMIESSGFSDWVKNQSIEAFRRLAEAEGRIHGEAPEDVQFHEVGAIDSIVDMVGTFTCIEELMPLRIVSTRVNVGQGTLACRHGLYPAPGPATLELLKGVPVYASGDTGEMTTPTGAALLVTLASSFSARPPMTIDRIGYGAGTRDFAGAANVLRLTLGYAAQKDVGAEDGQVAVIEANVDDMNPQVYGYFLEKALAAGALDVYAIPAQMKKNRPGTLLTVICQPGDVDSMAALIFAETTTIGIRYGFAFRQTLGRRFVAVKTPFGEVTMKVSASSGRTLNYAPEFESCRRLALETGAPLKDIMAAAVRAYLEDEETGRCP